MVVVEKNAHAKIILDYIRNNTNFLKSQGCDLQGNINFITLDKVDQVPPNIPFPNHQDVKLLYNLIKPVDDKFKPAFFKAAYNTIVVEDENLANNLGYTQKIRNRIVTLAPRIIDSSGSMMGGGTSKIIPIMSSKRKVQNDPNLINQLNVQLDNYGREFKKLSDEKYNKESQYNRIKEE